MKLVAQRLVSPDGREGVNAFGYWHGGLWWTRLPPPNALSIAGASLIAVAPTAGHRVRSYIDVLAPDAIEASELHEGIMAFADALATQGGHLPIVGTFGRVSTTFGTETSLIPRWYDELQELANAVVVVGPLSRR
jgi:hypothetical protein